MSLTKETIFQYAWNLKNEIKSLSFIIFQLIVSISCKKKKKRKLYLGVLDIAIQGHRFQ